MNLTNWWDDFNRHRIANESIVIEADEESHFRFWLRNFDGMHFYEPVTLKPETPGAMSIADRAWGAPLIGKLIYGLPIYSRRRFQNEASTASVEEWVKQETPIDVRGYLAQYGHKITLSRTRETFVIVSNLPLKLSGVVIR
jgi:hypothetical protein